MTHYWKAGSSRLRIMRHDGVWKHMPAPPRCSSSNRWHDSHVSLANGRTFRGRGRRNAAAHPSGTLLSFTLSLPRTRFIRMKLLSSSADSALETFRRITFPVLDSFSGKQ
jgi:hypothetical protein